VTANEIHVPVGQPVDVRLTSADVIHSFWVPEVMPKMDMIPGHTNDTWFTVDKAGTYRGQCAEYCGIEHAHMAFEVVAQSPADFARWLDGQRQDAATPTSDQAKRGYDVLTTGTCATCHTVRGTPAHGTIGPDLTHLAGRSTLGALTVPNDRGNLAGWIANSQQLKPGNKMPPQPLSPADLNGVVAYLETLR
jgi:cytochrome c oxidase subunit II